VSVGVGVGVGGQGKEVVYCTMLSHAFLLTLTMHPHPQQVLRREGWSTTVWDGFLGNR